MAKKIQAIRGMNDCLPTQSPLWQKLENAVKENEKGCLYYKFYKLREENAYAVIESFESEEMDEEHQQTQHFKDIVPELLECLDGTYTREFLDPLRQNND